MRRCLALFLSCQDGVEDEWYGHRGCRGAELAAPTADLSQIFHTCWGGEHSTIVRGMEGRLNTTDSPCNRAYTTLPPLFLFFPVALWATKSYGRLGTIGASLRAFVFWWNLRVALKGACP